MGDFSLTSLRGGLDDFSPPSALAKDACMVAENVEFFRSTLGEKRRGTATISLAGPTAFSTSANKVVPFMYRHLPSADETAAELWALATASDGSQQYGLARKTTAWSDIAPADAIDVTSNRNYHLSAASLHGKMFLAYRSVGGVDRLHVWDGTSLRRAGLATPAAPAVADTGVGTYSGKRYFRTRYTVQSAGITLRRSEPSLATTFSPAGTGISARITKPAATSPAEGETHWEVEASINNADFFRIATVLVGTTTYDDSIAAYTTGYLAGNTLSEDVGDYTAPWSPKFVVTDEDRLVIAGSHEQSAYASQVGWTVVAADAGAGNDERIPIDTDNMLSLDGLDGGELTAFSGSVNGYLYGFKLSRIYKLARTGQRARAYDSICLTKSKGALPGSLIEAVDETGAPALYALDPRTGPYRIAAGGPKDCGRDVLTTWGTVNLDAALVCHGIYYPANHQIHWWVATGVSTTPNKKIVVQINEMRPTEDGVRRGWATWSSGRSVSAYSSCMFSSNIDAGVARSLTLVPFVGLVELASDRNLIQRCDTGSLDSAASYTATIKTGPFVLGGLLNKVGAMAGALLAKAASGVTVSVRAIRDFGLDSKKVDVLLTASASELHVIKPLDNLFESEIKAFQLEFGDLTSDGGLWELNRVDIQIRQEETA